MTTVDYLLSAVKSLFLAMFCYDCSGFLHWVAYMWMVCAVLDIACLVMVRPVRRLKSAL